MSDLWEKLYNTGQLYPSSFLPGDDADGDGFNNLDESTAGTDPEDGTPPAGFLCASVQHVPAVYSISPMSGETKIFSPESFLVTWPSIRGKHYTLLYSPDLSPGSWMPIGDPQMGYGYELGKAIAPTYQDGSPAASLFWRVAVTDADIDGDGFTDYDEIQKNTNLWVADRDDDGLPDEWEIFHSLNPDDDGSINPDHGREGDPDDDGLFNHDEYWYGGDPRDPDTDDDGLDDFSEAYVYGTAVANADPDSDGLTDYVETLTTLTDPWDPDSDADGLTDGEEISPHGTNPLNADTDGDTLKDGWEILHELSALIGTGPDGTDGNPDDDGLSNLWEWKLHLHPKRSDSNSNGLADGAEDPDKDSLTNLAEINTHDTDPTLHDTDGDRLPDGWEITFNLDPKNNTGIHGGQGDPDNDLLLNFQEYLNSTSPRLASTDGDDGASDYIEFLLGTDPTDINDGGGGGGGPISPEDRLEEATFRVGGDYASWRMEVKGIGPRDRRKLLAISPRYNEWDEQTHKLRHNNHYEITLHHTGSRPQDDPPWYCWEASISSPGPASPQSLLLGSASSPSPHDFPQLFASSAATSGEDFFMSGTTHGWLVDNREGLFVGHTHSEGENLVQSKKAQAVAVAIRDNIEATGVDATSINAGEDDPGYEDKYWIMAPSGDDPNGNECKNDILFQIPLAPDAQMAISYPEGSQPPATATPATLTLGTADAACSWHGESATTTEEPVPTYKIGDNEVEVALPIHVKTMKRRTVKVAVYRVNELKADGTTVQPDPLMMPTKAQLEQHLNQLFAYQINTWFTVDFVPQTVSVNFGNGVLEGGDGLAHTVDQNAVISAFGGLKTESNIHLFLAGASSLIAQEGKGFTSPPNATCWSFAAANGAYNDPNDLMITIGHEIGHVFFGAGHPDKNGGKAPLKGTNPSKRLMYSDPDANSRLIVKREWDEAETWLIDNVR